MNSLQPFIKNYFNRYQFFVTGYSTKYMHGLYDKTGSRIFNLKLVDKTPTIVTYKFEKNKFSDPVLSFVSKVTRTKEPMYLRIQKANDTDNLAVVYPIGPVPTHFMLYVRDLFQQHMGFRTWVETLNRDDEKALVEPFNYDFSKIFDLSKSNFDLSKSNNDSIYRYFNPNTFDILEKYSMDGQFLVDQMPQNINQILMAMPENTIDKLLAELVENYTHPYSFRINDKKWSSHDAMNMNCIYNKAARFARFSPYFHSLTGGVRPQYASEGGLCMDVICPGVEFIFSDMMYKYRTLVTKLPDASLIRGSERLRSKYSIAYWRMIYLRELMENFGIETLD